MITITEKAAVKIPGAHSLFIAFNYAPETVEVLKQTTVYNYDKKTHEWEIPVTDLSFVLDRLCVIDDITLNILPNTNIQATMSENIIGNFKTQPFQYQLDAIQYGLYTDKWLLLDAPGLGKTLTITYLAQELKAAGKITHCLVICGINTLKSNWKKEIGIHSNLSCKILGERVTRSGKCVNGSVADRLQDLKSSIEEFFVITNIETLRNDDIIKEINKGPNAFDMIVVDEIHTCKSPTSQQGKNLLKLNSAKYKIGATGTLLLNNPLDAYVPLKWIGVDHSTYTNFKYYYCNFSGPFNNILSGYKNIRVLKDQLETCSLRRTKDLLDLPPKTIINEYVDMNDAQRIFYDNVKQGIVEQVDKVKISTANLLSIVSRLRQATACPSILTTEPISSAKIERAIDLIQQIIANGDKVVVFSTFKETLNVLNEKLASYKPLLCTGDVKDDIISQNIDTFQTDNIHQIFLATWQKMGTGITLTKASYAIFLDTPWTQAQCLQAEDRIYRVGSRNPVFIYYLWCKDTVDMRVKDLVETKGLVGDYIVDGTCPPQLKQKLIEIIEDLQSSNPSS